MTTAPVVSPAVSIAPPVASAVSPAVPFDASDRGAAEYLKLTASQTRPRPRSGALVLGSVCYDPSVPSIWKGMTRHFAREGLEVDVVTFPSYERLVDALWRRHVHIAWNGPLAHARLLRLGGPWTHPRVLALGMRDSDRDCGAVVVAREDARVEGAPGVAHRRVATGTVDSPQAYVLPLRHLAARGCDLSTRSVTRFDRDLGKHGDTALGEDAVLEALASGAAEVGLLSRLVWDRAVASGRAAGLVVVEEVAPFDHCQFSALVSHSGAVPPRLAAFTRALLAQRADGSGGHAEDARTMALEGIRERWLEPRGGLGGDPAEGYADMLAALDAWREPKVRFPGVLHSPRAHPFKHLIVDYRLVRDSLGC